MVNVPTFGKKRLNRLDPFHKTHLGSPFTPKLKPGQAHAGKGDTHCHIEEPGVVAATVTLSPTVMPHQKIFQRGLEKT